MNKKEILELKRRMTKTNCTFTRMCGCYVNARVFDSFISNPFR